MFSRSSHLGAGLELLEDVGRPFLVEGVEQGHARGVVEVLEDVGEVRGMDAVELGIGLGQLDLSAREVHRLDFVPEDELARQGLPEGLYQSGQGLGDAQPAEEPLETDIDGDEVAARSARVEDEVVDPDELSAVHVDDLLVEEMLLDVQEVLGGREASLSDEATME